MSSQGDIVGVYSGYYILLVYLTLSAAHVMLVRKALEGGHRQEGTEVTEEKKGLRAVSRLAPRKSTGSV